MADKRANIKTTPQNDYNGPLRVLLLLMKPTIMFYIFTFVVVVLPAIANEAKSRPPPSTATF